MVVTSPAHVRLLDRANGTRVAGGLLFSTP